MAKIFISFFDGIIDPLNPNAMSCHYESILNEFKKHGNDILYFQHQVWGKDLGKTPKEFLQKVKKFNPELIILFDNRCYCDLYKFFDCPIIIWEADSCLYFANQNEIRNNPNRFHYIVCQTYLIKKIKEIFKMNSNQIHYMSSATSIMAESIPQTTNISFIGTKFNAPDIVSNFMHSNPNEKEINTYKKMIDYVENNPFITDSQILKKFKVISGPIKNCFNVKDIVSVLSVKNRNQILSVISDLGLDLYGTPSWIDGFVSEPNLVLSFKNKLVYTNKENQDIYNSSKISINVNHTQAKTGFSWRVCDIMASNSCLVTEYKKDLSYLFPKIKIPTFTNRYEAYDICKKILKNDKMRQEIVLSCQDIINKKYRYEHLLANISQFININLLNNCDSSIHRLQSKYKTINPNKKMSKLRIQTRSKLFWYSMLMMINQIPLINKPLTPRDEIVAKINEIIKYDNN